MRVSYSALETYKSCPLKFKYQNIEKIPAPKSIEAAFGTAVHSALKEMFTKKPLFPALDEVVDHFRNKWEASAKKILNEEKNKQKEEVLKMYVDDGISMLSKFYKKNPAWNFNPVELESFFQILLKDKENNERHVLTGKIDRVDKLDADGSYEIIDYKTGKRMPPKEDIDKDFQLSIYNMGLLKKWPHLSPQNIKLSLYFLKHGEKIETKRTEKDIKKTKEEILKLIREINNLVKKEKEFSPTPSALCDWCGYKKTCPMWRHLYDKNSEKIDENQTKTLIEEYFTLKDQNSQNNRRIREINAQIGDFMDHAGIDRVFGENGYITRILQERASYNMVKIKEILEDLGKWDEVFKKKKFTVFKASKKKVKK